MKRMSPMSIASEGGLWGLWDWGERGGICGDLWITYFGIGMYKLESLP
jgi:hypothetical protein